MCFSSVTRLENSKANLRSAIVKISRESERLSGSGSAAERRSTVAPVPPTRISLTSLKRAFARTAEERMFQNLLWLRERNLRMVPLIERKQHLARLLRGLSPAPLVMPIT